MKVKKYIYIITTFIGCMLLLTGCSPHITIDITYKNLPENSYMFLLVRPVEEKTWQRDIPDYIKGTELENYNRNGWVTYLDTDMVFASHAKDNVIEIIYGNGESNDDIRAFCYKFKEICFAVMNDDGKLLYITSTLDLLPSDRFGCAKYVTYDAKTDKFHVDGIVEDKICGITPFGWWLIVTVFSWPTSLGFLALIIKTIKRCNENYLQEVHKPLIILAAPSVLGILMGLTFNILPFFGGSTVLSDILELLKVMFILNTVFIAAMLFLLISIKRNKQKNT